MKKLLLSTTAAISIASTFAFAQTSYVEQIIAALEAQDYDSIEIKTGPTQIKVEAIRDGMKLEAIYDAETGEILSQEVEAVDADEDHRSGTSVRAEDEDFLDHEDDDDDHVDGHRGGHDDDDDDHDEDDDHDDDDDHDEDDDDHDEDDHDDDDDHDEDDDDEDDDHDRERD